MQTVAPKAKPAISNNGTNGTHTNGSKAVIGPRKYYLQPEPEKGTCYLADLASVVRSKNSGPYELTFDVMFDNQETYRKVKDSGVLNRKTIAKLYNLEENEVIASLFWDQAMAYKATIVRQATSGGYGETDTHGSQQHVPLMFISCPFPRE